MGEKKCLGRILLATRLFSIATTYDTGPIVLNRFRTMTWEHFPPGVTVGQVVAN